jgi:ribosome modulation factor
MDYRKKKNVSGWMDGWREGGREERTKNIERNNPKPCVA